MPTTKRNSAGLANSGQSLARNQVFTLRISVSDLPRMKPKKEGQAKATRLDESHDDDIDDCALHRPEHVPSERWPGSAAVAKVASKLGR